MPKKVLIVDANVDIWQSIGAFLGDKEYEVGYSGVYEDALELAQSPGYELVIVDMSSPKPEGLSFLARLRELQPETIVIAVSEPGDRDLEQEALSNGADTYLIKPVNESDLLQALSSVRIPPGRDTEPDPLPGKKIEHTLLRGFTPDQQGDFRVIGSIRSYKVGDVVPLNEDSGTMIWVEKGKLMVSYNDIPVECLSEGDFWGEQTFVNPGISITSVAVKEFAQIRHFSRKRLMEYFTYHDETLIKRYMINLIICLHLKWNKTVTRLALANQIYNSTISEEANVPEL
jgi:CheY-like chemotaxis protein